MHDDFETLINNPVYVRTMGAIKLGRLLKVTPTVLILDQASWLADPDMDGGEGRAQENVLKNGLGRRPDVQRYSDPIFLNRGVTETLTRWRHALPKF